MRRALAASVAVVLLLAGCTSTTPAAETRTVEKTVAAPAALAAKVDPAVLLGTWRVSNSKGKKMDVWLRLGKKIYVWDRCGIAHGQWGARDDAFLATVVNPGRGCDVNGDLPFRWLHKSIAYGYAAGVLSLFDNKGRVTVSLTKDGSPPIKAGAFNPFDKKTGGVPQNVSAPFALPDGAVPPASILGHWVPSSSDGSSDMSIDFADNGWWNSSAGCFRQGRWAMGAHGSIISNLAFMTAVWCGGDLQVDDLIMGASGVGMVGDELTFYDAQGVTLGALVRG